MQINTSEEVFDAGKLRWLKRVFLGLSLFVLILILVDQVSTSLGRRPSRETEINPEPLGFTEAEKEPLAVYQEIIQKRNLFNLASLDQSVSLPKVSMDELTKDLRLKGIVAISEPEAILEDARTQQTSFLKQGSKIGELLLKEIKQESIILSYGNEEKELKIQGGQIQ